MFFVATSVVWDTWHILSGSQCATCQVQNESTLAQVWGPHGHVASPNWMEIQSGWMKWIRKSNEPMRI